MTDDEFDARMQEITRLEADANTALVALGDAACAALDAWTADGGNADDFFRRYAGAAEWCHAAN